MESGADYDVSSAEETAQPRSSWKPRHGFAAVLGAAALIGCGAAVTLKSAPAAEVHPQKKFTARMLFESDHIHEAAAQNVLNTHRKLPRAVKSEQEVKKIVGETFRNIIESMKANDPETFAALEKAELSEEQHHGVAHILSSLKDPRMVKLGVDTATALREANSEDKAAQAKSVYDKLMPRKEELKALYNEIVPKHMQYVLKYKPGDGFENMLQKDNVKLLKTVGGSYYDQFSEPEKSIAATNRRLQVTAAPTQMAYALNSANPGVSPAYPVPATAPEHSWQQHVTKPYKKAEEAIGIVSTAAAEADAMLRIIKPVCKEFNKNLHVSPVVTSAIGVADFALQTVDCELDAIADSNMVEGMGCPVMSSSAAFDAGREVFTVLGLLGDNNPKNGKQGNHAGDPTVHQGVLNDSKVGKAMEETFPLCALVSKCPGQAK
jgi:hypothetical protein